MNGYRRQLPEHTTSAALFAQPPVLDFADSPLLAHPHQSPPPLQVRKTHTRRVVTLPLGPWIARETIWRDPASPQVYGSAQLRRLVAPGCTYGYDVVVEVGRKLFVEAQSVRQIIDLLKQSHVALSASTGGDLGRRFIVLLALAHRRCTHRLRQALSLHGGYILHLDATYEDKSPLLMTGIDAVMEIVLGNIKLPSEKAAGIVPFLRQLQECFGPPLARRAQEAHTQLQSLIPLAQEKDWRRHLPFHRLRQDLHGLLQDYPLKHTLNRLEEHGRIFDQLRHALQIAPVSGDRGLNHDGEAVEIKTRKQPVEAFTQEVRVRPDYLTTAALQKMIQQIDPYGPKLFADPLAVSTPRGPRTIQPQRTNNILERFFRDLKRDCRHKTGCHSLGRTLRTLRPDTPLVKNLQNPDYLKILLDGRPSLEALFAEIDPATVRQELSTSRRNPERMPRALQRFITELPDSTPIKNFIKNAQANRISCS